MKLGLSEKLAYGAGDFASVLYWQTFMVYLAYFYTDVFGLEAAAVGTMLGLSRSLDALLDPMIGLVADRTRTRWGTFRPWLLFVAVPFAVAGVLTFTVPAGGKLAWAWVTYNGLMVLYTAINIPYTAMLGVLTPDPKERTVLTSVKFVCAFAAGVVISATLLPLTGALGGGAAGWQRAFAIVGAIAVACFLVTFRFTRERVLPPKEQRSGIRTDLLDLVRNGPWLVLVAATLALILFVAIRSSVTVHYFKYVIGTQAFAGRTFGPEAIVSAFATSGQLASLLGVVALPFFTARLGKKRTFVAAFAIAVASTAAFWVLRPEQLLLVFALNALGSAMGGALSAILWAMYADTADYGEWKNGRRATGLVFSASAFSQKQGWAVGAWVALSLLDRVGFVANAPPSDGTRAGLVLLMSLAPSAFGILAILLVLFYPLDEARMARIAEDLEARRAEA